jgi:hypothetical protein
MGGSSPQVQTRAETRAPYAAAVPALNSILGNAAQFAGNTGLTANQSQALDQMTALAKAGNPYAPGIDSYATTMLAGGGPDRSGLITDAYNNYKTSLAGTAAGDNLDPNKNPWFQQVTDTIGNDVQNRVNSMFAGAGRDLSGANQGALSRGLSEGLAPVFGQQYQFERGNQMNALAALYGAGNTTAGLLSNLDQTRLGNMGQGVNAANAALAAKQWEPQAILAAEAQRTGIPIGILAQLSGIVGPLANVGGTTNSTTTTPGQQTNWAQLLTGAAIAGVGAATGNPMMMMNGARTGMSGLPLTGYTNSSGMQIYGPGN